jgi:predicted PurR-regulated permease PerM
MSTWRKQDIFKLVVTIFVLGLTGLLFAPFYAEILLAAIFAFAIEPTLGRFLQARHLRYKTSVAGILVGMFLLMAAPITMVAYKAYAYFLAISKAGFQNTDLFKKLVVFRTQLFGYANDLLETMHLQNAFDMAGFSEEALSRAGNFAVGLATGFAARVPEVLLSVFVFCVALYFFLAEARMIKNAFLRMHFLSASESRQLIAALQSSSYTSVVTSVALGACQAVFVTVGSLIFDGGDAAVVFVITFFCSFVPVIGAGPVAFAMGIYKLVMGSYGQAFGFLIVGMIAGTADNVLRPYLFSSSDDNLHPVASLLALIGALMIFGMPGVFLGPVIASIAVKIIPIFYSSTATAAAKDPA